MSQHVVADQRLALALEAAALGTWTWDIATGITTWDERLEALHGLPPGGFGGTFDDWAAALHPGDRAECFARVERALEERAAYVLLHRTTWPDGSVHWIECRGQVTVDECGEPTGTIGVALDVTEREHRDAAVALELVQEKRLVETLQQALLPSRLPTVPGVTVTVWYVSAAGHAAVGGDWYAAVPLPGARLGLAIGDVAGHGLPAVAEMAQARFSLRALALHETTPDVVLHRLNRVVRAFNPDAFITALYGILDPAQRTWSYATAGHCAPVLLAPGEPAVELTGRGQPPLGLDAEFVSHRVVLEPGSSLLLYTDGLVERRGKPLQAGTDRMLEVCSFGADDPGALCDRLLEEMLDSPNEDDIALVMLSIE